METQTTNIETLQAYREQKHKTEQLAEAARAGLQSQYTGLLSTAAEIQMEFKADFGASPELPLCVKTFTLVPTEDKKKPEQSEAAAKGKKIGGLKRSLTAAMKKGDKAKQADLIQQLAALGVDATTDPLAPKNEL
jgi:ABC-type sugar transport system substrate-binding protein